MLPFQKEKNRCSVITYPITISLCFYFTNHVDNHQNNNTTSLKLLASPQEPQDGSQKIKWLESEEVHIKSQLNTLDLDVRHAHMLVVRDFEIGYVIASQVPETASLLSIEDSDLDKGVYEGGLKIWECTSDLIEYLLIHVDNEKWKDANVLDLGCGAGLVGIMALLSGARVVFQDYNKEVLEYVTIRNCTLNCDETDREKFVKNCRFFSGDWDSFNGLLEMSHQFDYILTSETIYNTENYNKIINILKIRLKETGVAYIAAKTCYFGVGGGMRQFENASEQAGFKCEVCWRNSGGVLREILKVTKKFL